MNFFQHQDAARKKTGRLVLLFALAVVAIVCSVYVIVAACLWVNDKNLPFWSIDTLWNPSIIAFTAFAVCSVIFAGSLYQISVLGEGGGRAVAEMLDGRLLSANTTDWRERRLLNVVEEMALAAGMPVPPVYLLDHETGVNAFAAGFTPADAILGITRGSMQTLTRDELQGVIGHEFSHILNGDMRLNLRLMGLLYGILLLSLIGYILVRVVIGSGSSRRSSSDKKDGGGIVLAILAVGAGLFVIGYIGVFFGKLIKSAVSRQREYLADASSVQFTRNPEGIAGALKKIGALGSRLGNVRAEQASHLYFGNGIGKSFLSLLSTHPPLVDRIHRIDPSFDGDFSKEKLTWPDDALDQAALAAPHRATHPLHGILGGASGKTAVGFTADNAIASVGAPQPRHLDYAANLVASLSRELLAEIHDPLGAASVVYALLLTADPSDDEPGLTYLARQINDAAADRVRRALAMIAPLPVVIRLPLAQLTMTALRQLTPPQFEQFRRLVVALIRADRRVSLFEFGLHRMILKHLGDYFEPQRPQRVVHETIDQVAESAAVVLSAAARAGSPDDEVATAKSYDAGRKILGSMIPSTPLSSDACGFARLDEALYDLCSASGQVKQSVLAACAAGIARDGKITLDEGELVRTIADSLDSPMPPLAAPPAA